MFNFWWRCQVWMTGWQKRSRQPKGALDNGWIKNSQPTIQCQSGMACRTSQVTGDHPPSLQEVTNLLANELNNFYCGFDEPFTPTSRSIDFPATTTKKPPLLLWRSVKRRCEGSLRDKDNQGTWTRRCVSYLPQSLRPTTGPHLHTTILQGFLTWWLFKEINKSAEKFSVNHQTWSTNVSPLSFDCPSSSTSLIPFFLEAKRRESTTAAAQMNHTLVV